LSYFLAKAVGMPKAMELTMLSEKLDAAAIDKLGLATRLVADDKLEETGLAFAEKLASGPTIAYAGVKRNVFSTAFLDLQDYLRVESETQVACAYSEDIREAAKAFVEKRAPEFKGK